MDIENSDGIRANSKKSRCFFHCISAPATRCFLYVLLLTGMISLFIMRTVMPITLLAMVKDRKQMDHRFVNSSVELCLKDGLNNKTRNYYGGTLDWSMDIQYYILTSFYWTYITGQLIGGVVAQKFSVKKVLLCSFLASATCDAFIPLVSDLHYVLLIGLQILNGLAQSMVWPAYYRIISFWSPVTERSRFSTSFVGMSFGTTIGQVMAGFVIANFGWSYVFYVAASTGFLWAIAWYFFAFDTPEKHPRISSDELRYIRANRRFIDEKDVNIPWKSILTSVPVWAIIVTSFGRLWLSSTIMIYGSLYLKTVIGLDVENNGLWSGMPSSVGFFVTLCVSYTSDTLLKRNCVSVVNNRKIFSGISQIIPATLCFFFARLNCDITLIFISWCLMQILETASFGGAMVNVYDIAPNHAGPVMGFVQFTMMSPTIIATYVAKTIMQNQDLRSAWHTIFNVAGSVNLVAVLMYFIFASAEIQTWDRRKKLEKDDAKDDAENTLL